MVSNQRIDLANWEIFLWSLYDIGGDAGMVDVELAFLKAHELAPQRFSWRTRDDLPQYKRLSKALQDAEKKAGRFMTKTSDGRKRQLTVQGVDWIAQNKSRLERLGEPTFKAGQTRSIQSTKWFHAIQHSREFANWRNRKVIEFQKWRMAELLRCTPDSPLETWQSRIEQTKVAAHSAGRDDVVRFLVEFARHISNEEHT